MDKIQIDEILEQRKDGQSMGQISKNTGIPVSTVKSYFRRHKPVGKKEDNTKSASAEFCQQCGKAIKKGGRGKPKRFCKESCRRAWWKAHKDSIGSDSPQIKCAYCGKSFVSYESRKRKYCSHECYIHARFGKENKDE